MAYGTHWEWRGFGAITPRFARTFDRLPVHHKSHRVEDQYLWIPGLEVNAKFREGVENGFKFKRIRKSDGPFEVWTEDPDKFFEFPLRAAAWSTLQEDLEEAGISFPGYPGSPQNREQTTKTFENAGCQIVSVQKQRVTARWENGEGKYVLVEWAVVSKPQHCISIGLENGSKDEEKNLASPEALEVLRRARESLDLIDEPLEPLNYLEAVEKWANGSCI